MVEYSDKADEILPGDGRAGHAVSLEDRQVDESQTTRVVAAAVPHAVAHTHIGAVSRLKLGIGEFIGSATGGIFQQNVGIIHVAVGVFARWVAAVTDGATADAAFIQI